MIEDGDDGMTQQTGPQQVQSYLVRLSKQLQRAAARYGLDTVEMEALTAWGSMETETPSQSIAQQRRMLMTGLEGLSSIMSSEFLQDIAIVSALQACEGTRYAVVLHKRGSPSKLRIYLSRH